MSFTKQQTADKIYYDVVISNISSVEREPPNLYFNETRNNPFILNPDSYYLSIVRFTLDTTTLPIIQPVIQPDQGNRDLTLYSFTLSYTNPSTLVEYNIREYLIFEPQNLAAAQPSPPSQNQNKLQNNFSGYYDIYSTQFFIYLVNNTLRTAFANLQTAVGAVNLPTQNAPVMTWDTNNDIAILNVDLAGYDDTLPSYIKIYMNSNMFNLFSSFPVYIEGLSPATLGKNVRITTNSLGGSNQIFFPPTLPPPPPANPCPEYPGPPYSYPAIQVIQEYSTLAIWTPITSVVFTSNTLPIVPNQVSAPLLFLNGNQFTSGGNNADISQIITDFTSDDGIYKPFIKYQPTSQYRLISLMGNTPIYNLDVEVYYKNRIGELVPFRLSSGSTATIKFLFTRKNTEDGK